MVDIFGAEIPVPTFAIGTGKIIWVLIIFIFTLVIAIVMYVVWSMRVYNKKIFLFENIAGRGFQLVFKDRARLVKLGDGGEELLFLKKKKVYRTAYGQKMGKNQYWFAVGQDGYWYNFTLGDLDAKMGTLDIEPVDRDMRYMHVAIRKNIAERYKKQNFMEKYGVMMMGGFFLLIMIIGIWFLLDKMAEIQSAGAGTVEVAGELMKDIKQVVANLDTIVSGGDGLRPVPET